MKKPLRVFAVILILTLTFSLFTGCSPKWPAKPIEYICTVAPGGGNDIFTRAVAEGMKQASDFEQPLNVINKVGGGGDVAFTYFKGVNHEYSLCTLVTGDIFGWQLRKSNISIDDFKPVAIMAWDIYVLLVPKDAPYNNIDELIMYSKDHPGTITMSGSAVGGNDWIGYNLMCAQGLDADYVPYESGGEATTAVIGGHVSAVWQVPATAIAQIKAGVLKGIAVSTEKRVEFEYLKDIPTAAEQGYPDIILKQFRGVVAPKSMTDEHVKKLVAELKKVSESEWWKKNYLDPKCMISEFVTGDDMYKIMTQTRETMIKLLTALGK